MPRGFAMTLDRPVVCCIVGSGMRFATAVWIDPQTEHYCARIFVEVEGINLAAWGLTANSLQPIDIAASSIRLLGQLVESELEKISTDFPMKKFEPVFLGVLARGTDVRAALTEKLAAVAA